MDKWKAGQVVVISGMLAVTGAHVLGKHPGDNPHTETGTHGSSDLMGSDIVAAARSSGSMARPPAGHRQTMNVILQWWS